MDGEKEGCCLEDGESVRVGLKDGDEVEGDSEMDGSFVNGTFPLLPMVIVGLYEGRNVGF